MHFATLLLSQFPQLELAPSRSSLLNCKLQSYRQCGQSGPFTERTNKLGNWRMRQIEVTGGYVDLQKKRQRRNSDFSFFLLRQRPSTPCWFLQHYSHHGVSPLLPHSSSRRHGRRDAPFLFFFTISTPGSNPPPPENAYLRARCNRRSSCYRPASELATSTVCFALRSAFFSKLGHQKNRKNGAIGILV